MNNEFKKSRILLVDDVEMNLMILAEIIKAMGHEPVTALSAKDALDILSGELPELILTDVSMPDMTGMEFCEILKDDVYTRDIPVIFISAIDSKTDLSKAFELGAVDYILKPFDPDDVKVRINTHLKLYRMQQELEDANRKLNGVIKKQMMKAREEQKILYGIIGDIVSSRDGRNSAVCGSEDYMVRLLAQALQFSEVFEKQVTESFISCIETAATMHDIGMAKVPDYIIMKDSALNTEERAIMERHVYYGSENLDKLMDNDSDYEFGKILLNVIRYHHEKYDGTGYPEGLKGDDIPLEARIMAIIDTYDSMVNSRCYKEPKTPDQAFEIIESEAGRSFDPDIVGVFLKIKRRFR